MRAYLESYGCTLNKGEATLIEESLQGRGFEIAGDPESADIVIIAACAVIDTTERHMMKRVSELLALNKEVYVTGCLAAWKGKDIEELGAKAINRLDFEDLLNESVGVRSRGVIATVPISTGCVGNCSYCVTRVIRGSLKSYDPEIIIRKAKDLLKNGAREIRITAQDTGCYGFDREDLYLPELIEDIAALDGGFRIRVGMMTPSSFLRIENDLLSTFAGRKVYKFFHLPLQSADDDVLRTMKRAYTFEDYMGIIERIRARFVHSTIDTDIIAGFPGESWQSFMKSYRALELLRPDIVNITRFSPREGTMAFAWDRPLSRNVKTRSRMLTKLSRDIARDINRGLIGKRLEALTCEQVKEDTVMARSDSYKPIVVPAMELGKFISVEIVGANSTYLVGRS
jgi:MiaB-like tRNA modifying enzyme